MRHEAFFSGERPYDILVDCDVLQHRAAAEKTARHIAPVVAIHSAEEPVRLLDLACGRDPVIPIAAMRILADRRFDYTGVDISPQQIELARQVAFPDNAIAVKLIEGSAWDLSGLTRRGPFDVVFVGLNWHHGTPEEIWFLMRQVRDLLAPGGCLVNHDCYRPDVDAYLRRPRTALEDGEEVSLDQVPADTLAAADVPDFGFVEADAADHRPDWKCDLVDRLEKAYRDGGGNDQGARILRDHSWVRDFPISVEELRAIGDAAGFDVEIERYAPDASLAAYLALAAARVRP